MSAATKQVIKAWHRTIRECPFCAGTNTSARPAKGARIFRVFCTCGAVGPEGPSINEAIFAWNARRSRPAVSR